MPLLALQQVDHDRSELDSLLKQCEPHAPGAGRPREKEEGQAILSGKLLPEASVPLFCSFISWRDLRSLVFGATLKLLLLLLFGMVVFGAQVTRHGSGLKKSRNHQNCPEALTPLGYFPPRVTIWPIA